MDACKLLIPYIREWDGPKFLLIVQLLLHCSPHFKKYLGKGTRREYHRTSHRSTLLFATQELYQSEREWECSSCGKRWRYLVLLWRDQCPLTHRDLGYIVQRKYVETFH